MEDSKPLAYRAHLDLPLLLGLLALAAVGMLTLYSSGGENMRLLLRQGIRLAVAFAVMVGMAQIKPRYYAIWAPWLYGVGLLLLLAVLLVGDIQQGAQRWIRLGAFNFQPSELVKITVPMMIAYFFSERPLPPSLLRLAAAGLMVLVPTLLIAKEPDLGTAMLVASAGAFVLLLAGMNWRLIVLIGLLAAAAAPLVWHFMHGYQRLRVLTFLNPERDPLGAGYHIIQSKIAIGSGGLYGKGWMNGTQSQLDFVPERSTDFIFAVFSEEFGLYGVILLLAIYLFIVYRGIFIALQAQDSFTRLLAGSLVLTFFVYVFVNMGMVSGLLPVVGLPLPLVSYGGTSLVTVMAGFGILMSVQTHRRMLTG